ncbi:MAG: hypothetical protein WA632_08630 [Gallionella sp.]
MYQPATGEVAEVDVPPLNLLMVDGKADPEKWKTVIRQPTRPC